MLLCGIHAAIPPDALTLDALTLKALIATAMAMAHGQKMAPAIALRVPMILDFSQLAKVEVDRRRSTKDRRLNLQP